MGNRSQCDNRKRGTVTIEASEASGWVFDGWYEDGIKKYEEKNKTFIAEVDKTYMAVFGYGSNNEPSMILVEGGTFQMGNTRNDSEGHSDEKPVHTVNLTYDYRIGKYEVTFDEYDAFCNATGRSKPGDEGWGRGTRPVMNVSWMDAIGYCNWLSEKEGIAKAYDSNGNLLDGNGNIMTDITRVEGYRLPTEAEWEYAALGGSDSKGYKYAGSNTLSEVGWYDGNSGRKTQPVGQKKANELGLYDVSGNVWEWCHDWYGDYASTTQTNPTGPNSGSLRLARGGSWNMADWGCRVAHRNNTLVPTYTGRSTGFRVARTSATSSTENLIAHWAFDDNLLDSSGNGHHGRLGSGTANYVSGVKNSALEFSGQPQIIVDDDAQLDTNEEMTITLWYKKKSGGPSYQSLIRKYYADQTGQWSVHITNIGTDKRQEHCWFSDGSSYDSYGGEEEHTFDVNNEEWVHLAFVFNKGVVRKYRNGTLEDEANSGITHLKTAEYTNDHINIGYMPWGTNQQFYGYLDEIRLYSKALSGETINAIYQNER